MAVAHSPAFPAVLIAGTTGLVALARSFVDVPRTRSRQAAVALEKENSVMARGSFSRPLAAGVKVRCLLTARSAPDGLRNEPAALPRFERDGVIVELQPTRGRYGYQDVTVVVASSDLPPSPAFGWAVEKIA
jgi:hypothetical protein